MHKKFLVICSVPFQDSVNHFFDKEEKKKLHLVKKVDDDAKELFMLSKVEKLSANDKWHLISFTIVRKVVSFYDKWHLIDLCKVENSYW